VNIVKERRDGATVLRVRGPIQLGRSARQFAEFLDTVLEADQGPVLIDLADIDYMDSTGLGELVGYLARFEERARPLVLLQPRERIAALLKMTGLDSLFQIFDSEEAALSAVSSDRAR
jgi:anti-sigma B factor antagonist